MDLHATIELTSIIDKFYTYIYTCSNIGSRLPFALLATGNWVFTRRTRVYVYFPARTAIYDVAKCINLFIVCDTSLSRESVVVVSFISPCFMDPEVSARWKIGCRLTLISWDKVGWMLKFSKCMFKIYTQYSWLQVD